MKKKNQSNYIPDGELQCFVGTREVGKRARNQNGSQHVSPSKRLSDILLMRRFIRGAAQSKGIAIGANEDPLDRRPTPGGSDNFNHRLVGQSASSMSSASTNTNLRTNSSSLLMSTNSSSLSGSGGYYAGGGMGVGGRYSRRNSSVRSGRSYASGKSNATALTAVSSLAGSSSICSSASAAAAYKKGKLRRYSRYEDEISEGQLGINEKELNSMNKHIPALKSHGKSATFRQHYYPEGGWGWVITFCCYMVNIFTTGLQMSFGLIIPEIVKHCQTNCESKPNISKVNVAWIGATNLAISYILAPFLVSLCRRKSTRLTAVIGGLVMSLSLLFASFAKQYFQIFFSYGILFGIGCAMVRETSTLMLSQYFKRRREVVEMIASTGTGCGIAIFSNVYRSGMEKFGFRLGLQSVTGVLSSLFFLGLFYRSASLYHPQRRAILHLKDMSKRKGKDKDKIRNKPPYFDLTTLKAKPFHIVLLSTAFAAFGVYTPLFFFVPVAFEEGLLEDDAVLLQTFLGIATSVGSLSYGLIVLSKNNQCMISRQYLLQSSVFGIGISMLALASVEGYHGYLLFSWMYGVFLGGFELSLKIYTLERVRVRQFPRGWGFVQGAKAIPILLGIPIAGYISDAASNPKAGLYFSVAACFISAILFLFVDSIKSSSGNMQLGIGSQPNMYDNRGELCKTDTNLTFELLGSGVGGNVPESASIDSAGALQLMMMRNGGSRLERQLSFFQPGSSTNGSVKRKHSDNLIMKSISNAYTDNNSNDTDPCNRAEGSLECTCHPNESNTVSRKISILSNNSGILMEKSIPVRKKSSAASMSSKASIGRFNSNEVGIESTSMLTGGNYIEKNGIYEELSDAEAMINVCEDANIEQETEKIFQDNSDITNQRKSSFYDVVNNTTKYLQDTEDDIIQFSTTNLIGINRGQLNGVDDEVEEGGDILIDEELLAEAAEDEPELLSCTMIDEPLVVFGNNGQCIANVDIPLQQKSSLSFAENTGVKGEFLGMINEEDEELISPDDPNGMFVPPFGMPRNFQYSHIFNKQNSSSQLVNKNLSLSEPEINLIAQDEEKENILNISEFQDPISEKRRVYNLPILRTISKTEPTQLNHGILNVNEDETMYSTRVNGNKLHKNSNTVGEDIESLTTSNESTTSNIANTNAFQAITTQAEVTSYV